MGIDDGRESTRATEEYAHECEGCCPRRWPGRKRRRIRQCTRKNDWKWCLGLAVLLLVVVQARPRAKPGPFSLRTTIGSWNIDDISHQQEESVKRSLEFARETLERDVSPRPTPPPTPRPTPIPTPSPTPRPTPIPTPSPTDKPTAAPVRQPTVPPTKRPTLPPTAAPTRRPTGRPTDSPTEKPTRSPTVAPTPLPTARPVVVQTKQPTRQPVEPPTRSPVDPPTRGPTPSPTRSPIEPPTRRPTLPPLSELTESPTQASEVVIIPVPREEQPTVSPTRQPVITDSPTRSPASTPVEYWYPTRGPITKGEPTVSPTSFNQKGTTEPSFTASPTSSPTRLPSSAPTPQPTPVPSAEPTMLQPIPVSVPLEFDAILRNIDPSSVGEVLPRVAFIWRNHIGNALQEKYGREQVRSVVLNVLEKVDPGSRRELWVRFLQEQDLEVQASGQADVDVDPSLAGSDPFSEVARFLDTNVLTEESLQVALEESDDNVQVAGIQNDRATMWGSTSEKPSVFEIVMGFLLLALVLGSLAFWMSVLWKKRQKRLRKRQQAGIRKEESIIVGGPPAGNKPPAQTARAGPTNVATYPTKDNSSSSDESSYKGIPSDDLSDATSEFGRELKEAASLDRAAWEDFQRKKRELSSVQSVSPSVVSSVPGVAHINNVSMYKSLGSQDQGVEVEPGIPHLGTFPYGDELERGVLNSSSGNEMSNIQLTPDDAVQWTSGGVSLNIPDRHREEDSEDFEPYGDSKSRSKSRSLQESWDLEENPVRDGEGPQQYSFVYPLKSRDASDQGMASLQGTETSDDNSAAAFNASASVTSLSVSDNMRQIGPNDVEEEAPNGIATVMMKQVEELTNFVKKYDMRKEKRKERDFERQKRLSKVADSTHNANDRDQPSSPEAAVYPIPQQGQAAELPRSFDSDLGHHPSLDLEDDTSQRLGISRFDVQKPPAPLLSYSDRNGGSSQHVLSQQQVIRRDEKTSRVVQPVKERNSKQKVQVIGTPERDAANTRTIDVLRSNASVLDQSSAGAPSDEKSKQSGLKTPVPTTGADTSMIERSPVPSNRRPATSSGNNMIERSPIRSKNKAFKEIFSKFESKSKSPLKPPP